MTVSEGHVTGNGMMNARHIKSLRSELSLDLDSDSTFELSDSTHLQLQQEEAEILKSGMLSDDKSSFNVSLSSQLSGALQSSLERHFKETLLCDAHDIKIR